MDDKHQAIISLINEYGANIAQISILQPANYYFDLAGEEFGRRLLLTKGADNNEYCLRPDFTLPLANKFLSKNQQAETFGYFGTIFRQRENMPSEFLQAGIEFLGYNNSNEILEKTISFAAKALKVYQIDPILRFGSVAIFATILDNIDIPQIFKPRLLHRLGQREIIDNLLNRLANMQDLSAGSLPWKRDELIKVISEQMFSANLSLSFSRTPQEIADRYLQKQQLAKQNVAPEIIEFLQNYLSIRGEAEEALERAAKLAKDFGLDISLPKNRLLEQIKLVRQNHQIDNIIFSASFSPRLDYYTDIVFEMSDGEKILASGGEYHNLLQRLGAKEQINATGLALWIERLDNISQNGAQNNG